MITPFTGVTESIVPMADDLTPDHLLILAVPVETEERMVLINDPIFPLELIMPAAYEQTCHAVLEILRKEPVIQLQRLRSLMNSAMPTSLDDCIRWMLNAGIALRTRPMNPSVDPKSIGDMMGRPLFTIEEVDYRSDVLVIKQTW